jgi:hypothetical protein
LPPNSPEIGSSVMSNGINIVSKSSRLASGTDTLTMLPFGMIATLSTGIPGLDMWIASLPVSRASLSAQPESDLENLIQETAGRTPSALLTRYDPQSSSWRMCQGSFQNFISGEYLGTWPSSGTLQNGVVYRRPPLERRICENGFGYLPTPKTARGTYQYQHKRKKKSYTLEGYARIGLLVPTPIASDWKGSLGNVTGKGYPKTNQGKLAGGPLNPEYVEWLMGWPIGWTDLQPLAMDRFRQWLEEHMNY